MLRRLLAAAAMTASVAVPVTAARADTCFMVPGAVLLGQIVINPRPVCVPLG